MAELTQLETKLAEVMGLAQATDSTAKVMDLVDDEEVRQTLERMNAEAAETAERCEQVADQLDGKKTAVSEKARETKSEAQEMMSTYLSDDVDALDGFEFLIMAEAGELGHVEIVEAMNEQAGDDRIRELVEWVRPIQERHFNDTREASLKLAKSEDPLAPSS
jgi:rubrerythrin